MSYLLLIVEPPDQRVERGEQAGREVYDQMVRFAADLKERGKLLAVESLASESVRVQMRDGQPTLLDGPFAEAKEMIGGFFLLDLKATALSEAGGPPDEALMAAMGAYHEELVKAGVLLDATGLQPSSKGWRIRYSAGKRTVIDGPFAETKELIAGYTLIQVRSREEAMEWARRFPAPFGEQADGEIEVRQLYELEDFEPSPELERFKELDAAKRG
ncbi:hypothetical protein KCU90_g1282, partial [Aureobasidium melanogenum]